MTPPLRIVVVDDRSLVRETLCTLFSLEDDIQVVGEGSSGREAVKLVNDLLPDLVLLDFERPDELLSNFDGIEACRVIKAKALPPAVIVLTVHSDQESRQRAKGAGCDLFLEKGVGSEGLVNKVRLLLNRDPAS